MAEICGGGITKTLVNDTILTMIYDFSDVEIVHVRLSAKFAENTQKKEHECKIRAFFYNRKHHVNRAVSLLLIFLLQSP